MADHHVALGADAGGARHAQRLAHARQPYLTLDHVEDLLRARLDAVGDLPASGTLHELERVEIEQIGMAVAAPREAEAGGEEPLAEPDHPLALHREQGDIVGASAIHQPG